MLLKIPNQSTPYNLRVMEESPAVQEAWANLQAARKIVHFSYYFKRTQFPYFNL